MRPAAFVAAPLLALALAPAPGLAGEPAPGTAGAPAPGTAEEIRLRPVYEVGDVYRLSLDTTTATEAVSGGSEGRAVDETRRYEYRAEVEVLAVDARGRPVRERHDRAELDVFREAGFGPLLEEDASFEVRRDPDGAARVYFGAYRAERRLERILTGILDDQFEYSLQPALLDPGRPVEVGEHWALDQKLARELLRGMGVRVVEFGGPATATLRREPAGPGGEPERVVAYRIPIDWFRLSGFPDDARPADSKGHLEGEIRLTGGLRGRPVSSDSRLVLDMNGVRATRSDMARPLAWSVRHEEVTRQHARPLVRSATATSALSLSER